MPNPLDTRYTHGYDTPEDAAAGAEMLLRQQPNSTKQEYAALITMGQDGKYYHSGFDRSADASKAASQAPISNLLEQVPDGHKVVAVIHNHPNRTDNIPAYWLSQPDLNGGAGYGTNNDTFKTVNKNYPIRSKGVPTGPLQNYLVTGDTRLGIGNGKMRQLFGDATHSYDVGMTSEVLAQYPIDEYKLSLARKLMGNTTMSPDLKQQLLSHLIPGYGSSAQVSQP